MNFLSPSFVFRAALDEIAERRGFYVGNPGRYRRHFLDHRGLGLAADANGGIPYVMWGRSSNWRPDDYRESRGPVFWLRTDELAAFVNRVLPRLSRRFVLVTSEADYSPNHYDRASTDALLTHDKVAHWFCAQSDVPAGIGRHSPMPLGVPYPYRYDIAWNERWLPVNAHQMLRFQPDEFDRRLKALVAKREPVTKRKLLAVADFALTDTSAKADWGETRAQIAEHLQANPFVVFVKQRISQFALYRMYLDHAFVISPFGRGLDCYRTWEAILMGAIPIVKRSPLEPVFAGFPVVIVDDWSEITGANLAKWAGELAGNWDDGAVDRRLTLSYWLDQIRQTAAVKC